MNIDLKPIADSKVRQLVGDVCGVLVRKEDGRIAAVDEHGRVTWLGDEQPSSEDHKSLVRRLDIALNGIEGAAKQASLCDIVAQVEKAARANTPETSNEHGKNRYGLDMAYFRSLFNRELNRPLVDFRPDELARVLARAARTADAAVLQEPEFQAARAQGGQGAEPVAWASPLPDGTEQVTKELPERIYGVVPKDYQWYVRPLVYADAHPQPAQQGSVPEGIIQKLRNIEFSVRHEIDKTKESRWRVQDRINEVINLLSTKTTPQPEGDGSIKCSDRLPTEADEDICGQVWGWVETKGVGKWFRMSATETRDMSGNRAGPICTHWKPTGLKRPQPPAQEDKGDE